MMNKLDLHCIALLLLLLFQSGLSQTMEPSVKKELISKKRQEEFRLPDGECLVGLVESYGLFSTGQVVKESLNTCPSSPDTCCKYRSQKIMIYEMKKDLLKIQSRMKAQDTIIFDLLRELKLDMRYIERFKERQTLQPMNSCKAIATKLSFHDIDRVEHGMLEAREEMLLFVKSSHKGVYCALCSPQAQKYMDLHNGILRLSHKFCRDIVINTIKPMMYLHYEFKRFLNLMARFFQNCDAHGVYTDSFVPDNIVFEYSPEEQVIRDCWKFRNDPDWILKCAPFCDKFNTMNFSEFFEPDLATYMRMNAFLKRKRMHLNLIERTDDSLHYDSEIRDFPINPTTVGVIDNSKEEDNEHKEGEYEAEEIDALTRPMTDEQIKLVLERFRKNLMVSGDIGAKVSIAQYTYRFTKKGIDFYEIGKDAVATDALLKVVEAKMNAEKNTANTIESPNPPPAPATPSATASRKLQRTDWATSDSSALGRHWKRNQKSKRMNRKNNQERPFFN